MSMNQEELKSESPINLFSMMNISLLERKKNIWLWMICQKTRISIL